MAVISATSYTALRHTVILSHWMMDEWQMVAPGATSVKRK